MMTPQLRGRAMHFAGVIVILLGVLTALRDGSQHDHGHLMSVIDEQCETRL
jgi:hypothetical protein